MDRESKQRMHLQKGYRTIAHYGERTSSLLNIDLGGRNLEPYRDTHKLMLEKLAQARQILEEVRDQATKALKEM